MKYDIVSDLLKELSKENMYVNYAEQYFLRLISEKFMVVDYKNLGSGTFEFNLKNGITFNLFFYKEGANHSMILSTKPIKSNIDNYRNLNIKATFNLKTYRFYHRLVIEHNSLEECKFKISIKSEEGYYNIEGEVKPKSNDDNKLTFSYYDNEAIEYYKFRNKLDEFNYPDSLQFKNCGIIPDSFFTQDYKESPELFKIFNTFLSNPNDALKDIFEIMERKTKLTK